MASYPKNQLEFERWFSSDDKCLKYLQEIRWPQGFCCQRCASPENRKKNRGRFVCKKCGYEGSVTSGTVFHGSRMPLGLWFRAIWWMTNQKQGVSALGLKRTLGLGSYHTAWLLLQKLRRSMVRPGRDLLTGEVEVDETFLGAPKPGKPGRGAEGKELVVIAVEVNEKKIGRIRMSWVPDASSSTLLGFVKRNVKSDSLIITDGWKGYNGLSKNGYKHQRIPGESVGIAELLPHVHRIAGLLKRWILGTLHGGIDKQKHIDRYLNEYVFRFNRRTSGSRGLLFCRLIENAVAIDGESYKKIIRR